MDVSSEIGVFEIYYDMLDFSPSLIWEGGCYPIAIALVIKKNSLKEFRAEEASRAFKW